MVGFTIDLELMKKAEAQQTETFRGCYESQKRVTTSFKTDGSQTISPFD